MNPDSSAAAPVVAFAGCELIAKGSLAEVAVATKRLIDARDSRTILVFDEYKSTPVEIDFRGSEADVLSRLPQSDTGSPNHAADSNADTNSSHTPEAERRGPGRPKLGVVAKEVTLLPRHWEWLATQPGGASVTLRKLVESARKENAEADRVREARDSVYRFMLALAGDEPGFEEATRSLYAGDETQFNALLEAWPCDVRDHVRELAARAFGSAATTV